MKNEESLKNLLRKNGMRATPARVAILTVLEKTHAPLSVEEVTQKIRTTRADTATVYRTLNAFVKAGIARRIEFQHGHAHYERAGHHHHHITCQMCGRVEDVGRVHKGDIEKSALQQSKHFRDVSDHAIEFYGICRACSRKGRI